MCKPQVELCKPVYIGQAVLDYSKLEMYNLFYETLKKCSMLDHVELVGGDTDSFFLALTMNKNVTLNDVLKYLQPKFDSSNYPRDHPLYSTQNKAKLGCFKDETAGKEIEQMILLRPKMYSIKLKGLKDSIKRGKGISKSIVKRLKHKTYKKVLKDQTFTKVNMTILKSKHHNVATTTFSKRALSAWEDKRCWMSTNYSLPHGHPDTQVPPPKRPRLCLPPSGDVESCMD